MSADNGPWGQRDGSDTQSVTSVKEHRLGPIGVRIERTRNAAMPKDQGQHPVWAALSTVLLAAFIWWLSGSWAIALAVVYGLFVHEYGHVLAMTRLGMGPAKVFIVPFLGGVARSARGPDSEWHGVIVSLAGPVFGLLATAPLFAGWALQGDPAWLLGAFAIAMLNLVNMAPAPPLDGSKALGPVLVRIHPWLEKAALVLIAAAVIAWGVVNGSYIFAGFLFIALMGRLKTGAWDREGRALTTREAAMSLAAWIAVTGLCAAVALAALHPLTGSMAGAVSFGLGALGLNR